MKWLFFVIVFFSATYSDELQSVKIKFGWKYQFEFAGFIAAKEKGFYKEVGLDVTLEEIEDYENVIDEVLSSSNLYGVYASDLLIQKSKDRPVVLLSNYFKRSALVLLTKQNIFTPNDLIGKKVMLTKDELFNGSLAVMFKKFNISPSNMEVIPHSYHAEDFANSKVDAMSAFISNEPYLLDKLKKNYNVIDPTAYGIFAYNNNLFTSKSTATKYPTTTKNLIKATNKGWKYALEHEKEIIDIIYSKYSQKKSIEALEYEAVITKKLVMADFYEIGSIDKSFIENNVKILANSGLIDKNFTLNDYIFNNIISVDDLEDNLHLDKDEIEYLKNKKELNCCVNPSWFPIESIKDNEYIGVGSDFVNIFSKSLNIPIKIVYADTFKESLKNFYNQKCDIMPLTINDMYQDKYIKITNSYIKLPLAIASENDIWFFDKLEDLNSRKIGISSDNFKLYYYLKNKYPKIEFVFVKNIKDGLQKTVENEIFGYIDALYPIGYEIQKNFLTELKIAGKFKDEIEIGVGIRNSETQLFSIFEKLLKTISEDKKEQIFNKWVTFYKSETFDYLFVIKIIAFLLIILLFLLYRNRSLVKQQIELDKKNKELEIQKKRIDYIAHYDHLTKLPNRLKFFEVLEHAIKIAKRYNKIMALFFIDLDRFKIINDTLGHHIGDEMLKVVSKRVKSVLRESDTFSRFGGDEFVLLLETINNENDSVIVAQKILSIIKEPIKVDGHTLNTSASIGIALYPNDGKDSNTLIKNADSAMYLAKDAGKNNYKFFTKKMSNDIKKRLDIETFLREAINLNEFTLMFQPKYDLKTKKIIAAEALVRWNSKSLGAISPSEFIPIAEDIGFIFSISDWVLINSSKEFLKWKKLGFQIENISINFSSIEFSKNNILLNIKNIIDNIGIEAKNIEIEITERYVMTHSEKNLDILQKLRNFGFKISIDDFGTGYSSMSYLKKLPLDIIKIDKSFIKNIPNDNENAQITKAIIALSKNLGYKVIAEGIETKAQEEFLLNNGCDFGQGYYFSKPLNSDEFIAKYLENEQNDINYL